MEDHLQASCERVAEQPQGTPVDAMMDSEEVHIVLRIMEDLGFDRGHLQTLVAERLSRGTV